ncbi:MAG: CorA family divalent cation transporter [Verrucomicrobiota bacterium]
MSPTNFVLPPTLPRSWEIPVSILNRLGRDAGPQRSMLEERHLLIILHRMPGPDDRERVPVFFHRTPEGGWRGSESRAAGPTALREFLASWESRIHQLEDEETRATTATQYHNLLEAAAPVLRASRGLHRALQQAREMVRDDRDIINFRDTAAGIERSAELLMQDAQFGLNFIAARQSEAQADSAEQMAASAHRLNILAALFLPLTALCSVFGMDIHSGLEDHSHYFWIIIGAGVLLGLLVAALVVRRQRT